MTTPYADADSCRLAEQADEESLVSDSLSLQGKTAIVTGASAGIGNRLARTLVLAGARVAAVARRTTAPRRCGYGHSGACRPSVPT